MFNKNGESDQYCLKFGIGNPVPSDKEVEEFLEEIKRRANREGMSVSGTPIERQKDPNQLSLFDNN